MLYCPKCDEFVDDEVWLKKETYQVINKYDITVNANVHCCPKCHSELFSAKDDAETLNKVQEKFEALHGPINVVKLIKKVK